MPALFTDESARLDRPVQVEPGCMRGRSVVVPAAADGVSCPPRQRKYHADNEEDDPKDEKKMREGEGRDEAGEQEAENDEDDSETDHDVCLVSADVGEEDRRVNGRRLASHRPMGAFFVMPQGISATYCRDRDRLIQNVRPERMLIESGGMTAKPIPYRLCVSTTPTVHLSGDAR
jgi:hypothetical protein